MSTFDTVAMVLFGIFIIWRLYAYIRSKPEALSKEAISKSSNTMLWVLLGLTVFIGTVAVLL
jgi:succinate-acetate transporter protein